MAELRFQQDGPAAWLVQARHSVRAYLPQTVADEILAEVLRTARHAPSGNNIQPWRVHVLRGEALATLVNRVCAAFDDNDGSHVEEYPYYPAEFFEPYLGRRRATGWGMYGVLGIAKGDREAMRRQHRRNFEFFGAPVGLMFTIDRQLSQGSWLDYGMFLQQLMLAASAHGLATCAQAAWNDYHRIIAEALNFSPAEQLVCGMALGYADPTAAINGFETDRAELREFVVNHG